MTIIKYLILVSTFLSSLYSEEINLLVENKIDYKIAEDIKKIVKPFKSISAALGKRVGNKSIAEDELIEKFENKKIIGAGFIINLPELKGCKKLRDKGIKIHSLMEF